MKRSNEIFLEVLEKLGLYVDYHGGMVVEATGHAQRLIVEDNSLVEIYRPEIFAKTVKLVEERKNIILQGRN